MRSHVTTQHYTKEARYCFAEKAIFSDGSSSIAYCTVHTLTIKIVFPLFNLTQCVPARHVHISSCKQATHFFVSKPYGGEVRKCRKFASTIVRLSVLPFILSLEYFQEYSISNVHAYSKFGSCATFYHFMNIVCARCVFI